MLVEDNRMTSYEAESAYDSGTILEDADCE